jgi:RNA polymerase sigma-70 factor (ECF subfamily)
VEELIAEHIPRLRRYARALAGARAQSDDLVQDTLERAWTRRHLWRPGSDLRAWLFTIMHNLWVNRVRAHAANPEVAMPEEALELPVAARHDAALELRDLARALDRLPIEFREVLLLVGVEQLRYEEIAEVLGVPLGTVMSRLSRGRERLRALLAGPGQPLLRRVK